MKMTEAKSDKYQEKCIYLLKEEKCSLFIKKNKYDVQYNLCEPYKKDNYQIINQEKKHKIDESFNKNFFYYIKDKPLKKEKNFFTKNELILENFYIIFIIIIILLKINGVFSVSYIILKINKSGLHKILFKGGNQAENAECNGFSMHSPKSIEINGNIVSISAEYNFTEETNTIKLEYYSSENDFKCLFYGCSDIEEIDASNLVTTGVTNMESMFNGLSSLTSINLANFDTKNVLYMNNMFKDCSSLKSLNLTSFDTKKVRGMNSMFNNCSSLVILNLSNFNTPVLEGMDNLFFKCNSLISLDVSNFTTSSIEYMGGVFVGCSSLNYLNLSNFRTSNVKSMTNMFQDCKSLNSLDLSNFDTILVENFENMFFSCISLTYLDLSNFNTKNAVSMLGMFYNCENLIYLNISNFNTSSVTKMGWMFYNCKSLVSIDLSSFNTSSAIDFDSMFLGCESLRDLDLANFRTSNVNNTRNMFYKCSSLTSLDLSIFDFSKLKTLDNMFYLCSNLSYIHLGSMVINDANQIKGLFDKDLTNPTICIKDQSSLAKIISILECRYLNNSEYWGEYMENITNSNNLFLEGCLLSKDTTQIYSKCYKMCSYLYFYNEKEKKYICTKKLECPEPYDKLIQDKNECVISCQNTKEHKCEFEKQCLKVCPKFPVDISGGTKETNCTKERPFLLNGIKCVSNCTIRQRQNKFCITSYISIKEENYEIIDRIISQTRNELTKNFNESVVNGNKINERGVNITITRIKQEKENDYYINLSICEEKLIDYYKILPKNESLYLLRIDVKQIGMRVPSFEYEVFYPLYDNNLFKLDLSICKGIQIYEIIPQNLSDIVDKYNSSSPYYNDICHITDSDSAYDIALPDKKENYVDNNMGICEINCDFIYYNYETHKAICSCGVKTEIPLINSIKFDKESLLNSFSDINNFANLQMMKCYKTVFQKKYILKNIGCFIYASLIILDIICLTYFILKDHKNFIKKIDKLKIVISNITKKNNDELISSNSIRKKKNKKSKNNKNKDNPQKSSKHHNKNRKNKVNPPKSNKKIKINKIEKEIDEEENSDKKSKVKIKNKDKPNKSKVSFLSDDNNNLNKGNIIKNESCEKLNFSELNSLKYEEALIQDERTYSEYYCSLLRTKHLILYIFYSSDYNSTIIKVSILIFIISTSISVNALFFSDSTMHKIYADHGKFNFMYQLPHIIFSSLISGVLNFLIKLLGITEKNLLKMKKKDFTQEDINEEFEKLIRNIKIKFIIFYITSFSILFLFWYYVTCFCGVYINTQTHLFKDSLSSFITSLIIPFVINLLPGIFRIWALRKKKKKLYDCSKILQLI